MWSTANSRSPPMSPQLLRCSARATQHPQHQGKHQPDQMPSMPWAQVSQAAIRLDGPKPGSGNVQEASSSAQSPVGGPQPAATPKLQPKSSDPCSGPSELPPSSAGTTQGPGPPSTVQARPGPPDNTGPRCSVSSLETPAGYTKPSTGRRQSRARQGRKRTLLWEQKPVTGHHRESAPLARAHLRTAQGTPRALG
ncbi:hypothetical protein NDU88_005199 [Pleurodeles waltl]|uniref:Uncharacterized protein n=1 Tax=Pleurodeles waltl TaxID=8319 RepID=A0AAV7L042_PLEWA|nr:hypothetical protein NDU88_005199 [Pleurodeles waltl]